eukprot:m.77486 g.77486  ORF g.77486 m.77486 type:complete len:447 (+) comp20680_c0_seq1:172-1512(+)
MSRVEVQTAETPVPVIFTAPHSLDLLRDGKEHHKLESNTRWLAQQMAIQASASSITWKISEVKRVKEVLKASGSPDPANMDPNFLQADDFEASEFHQSLRKVFHTHKVAKQPSLLVDLHGCRDPTGKGKYTHDIYIGLRGMLEKSPIGVNQGALRKDLLAKALKLELPPVLDLANIAFQVDSGTFTGQWKGGKHFTVSQQATLLGVTHVMQVEISRAVREKMVQDDHLRCDFASALLRAWHAALLQELESKVKKLSIPQVLEDLTRTPVFCYGSNGVAQLRERCLNDCLTSSAAFLKGYLRVFAGKSQRWDGGAVANIMPAEALGLPGLQDQAISSQLPLHVKGSIVRLSTKELLILDTYEGFPNWYCRKCVTVMERVKPQAPSADVSKIGDHQYRPLRALAYVMTKTVWHGPPAKCYLDAIDRHLGDFWDKYHVEIRRPDGQVHK